MNGYEVKIVDASRDFSKKEILKIKMLSEVTPIEDVLSSTEDAIIENIVDWAELEIHNERSKGEKDYSKHVIITESGDLYTTGSESFWDSFRMIYDTMNEGEKEPFSVKVYSVKSKNYAGEFFNCVVV